MSAAPGYCPLVGADVSSARFVKLRKGYVELSPCGATLSSQSPLCSGRPGMGIPHGAPLLLLSPPDPLRWAPAGTPFCPRRLVGTSCISLVPTWRSGLAHSVVPPLQTEPTFVGLRFGLAPPGECVWKNTSCFYAACPTPSVAARHLPLTGGVGPGPPVLRECRRGTSALAAGAVPS